MNITDEMAEELMKVLLPNAWAWGGSSSMREHWRKLAKQAMADALGLPQPTGGDIQPLPDRIRAEADRAAGQWLTKEDDMSGPSLVDIIEDAIKAVIRGHKASLELDLEPAWFWWASKDAEFYPLGPFATRQEAIDEAISNELGMDDMKDETCDHQFYIVEGMKKPLKLSDFFRFETFLEDAERQACDEYLKITEEDTDIFNCSIEQQEDLHQRLKDTIDRWQKRHALVFETKVFFQTRNEELVTITKAGGHLAEIREGEE